MRRLLLLLVAAGLVAACVPSDDHEHLTSVYEVEPNDASGQATDLGQPGLYVFFGACLPTESQDWYKVATAGGTVEGSIHVTPPPQGGGEAFATSHPVDFYLRNANDDALAQATSVTDATISSPAAAEEIYVQVGCPPPAVAGTNSTYYFGTLRVP